MPYPVFPTHLFAFDDQDIDIERNVVSGGVALSGEEDLIATDGGGRVYAVFQNGPLLEREATLAWRSYTGQLDGGVTAIEVPFCDYEHQPVSFDTDGAAITEGEGAPVASIQVAAELRATTLHLSIDLPKILLGGEWLSIDHPGAGHRAYRVVNVVGQSGDFATVQIRPPLREKAWPGESVDFATPRCLMVQQGPASSLTNLGKYGEASIRFVEVPLTWNPTLLFQEGDAGYWFDFSNPSTLSQTANLVGLGIELNDPVAFARDLSGNDNSGGQSTLASRPLWKEAPNGLRGLYFDGVDDIFYLTQSVYTTAGCTVVACVQCVALDTANIQTIWGEVGEVTNARYYIGTSAGRSKAQDDDAVAKLAIILKTDASANSSMETDEIFADDNPRVVTMRDEAATIGTWIDNREEASTLARTGVFTITNQAIGAVDSTASTATHAYYKGYIFGLFAIDRPLTDTELAEVQQWFARRYYTTMRQADGVHTVPVVPRTAYFHGHRLVGTLTKSAGVRITDLEWDGDFRSLAYSPWSMGEVAGDAHSAPAILPLSDGRLIAGWTGHNAEYWVRVTTGDAIDEWGDTRHITGSTNELGLAAKNTYASFHELATGVYTFIRGRLAAETDADRAYWYSLATDPGVLNGFATATKFISGNGDEGPYVVSVRNGPYRVDFQISTGNPISETDNSIYHAYMAVSPTTGAVTFHQSDGTPITLPMDASDATLVYDGTPARGWVVDIVIGPDGHPRMVYVVFDDYSTPGDHSFHYGRWTGSAWVTSQIAVGGDVTIDATSRATGQAAIDPEDVNVVAVSCLPDGGSTLQVFRFVSDDDGLTWDEGTQLTDFEAQTWGPSFILNAPEPRLLVAVGEYENNGGVFTADTRQRLLNSVTGEVA